MTVSIRLVAIACGAAALMLALACGQPPEAEKQEAESATSPSQSAPSPQVPSTNPNVVTSKELPANFPEDSPLYPDAEVVESRATRDLGLSLFFVVKDDAPKVMSYYADGLAAKGWSTEIRDMPDGSAVFADKGNRTAAVMVTESRRGSEVRVLLGNQ
ncbi:MAG: hypothetical protein ACR2P8_14925 [Myxococcota bacterium]